MPGPGVLLWNIALDRPEYVGPEAVSARLAEGTHRAYDKSGATTTSATGQTLFAPLAESPGEIHRSDLGNPFTPDIEADAAEVDDMYRGGLQTVLANLEGAAQSASFGLYDANEGDASRMRRELNSTVVGDVAGYLLPALVPGGQFTVAGASARAAARMGQGAAARVAENVVAKRFVAGTVEGVADATAYVGAQQVANLMYDRSPDAGEHLVTAVGLSALVGGGLGGVLGMAERHTARAAAREAEGRVFSDLVDLGSDFSKRGREGMQRAISGMDGVLQEGLQRRVLLKAHSKEVLAGMPEEILALRGQRLAAIERAEVARAGLRKVLRADSMEEIGSALEQISMRGNAQQVNAVRKAMASYQDALSDMARRMAPTRAEAEMVEGLVALGKPKGPSLASQVVEFTDNQGVTSPGKAAARQTAQNAPGAAIVTPAPAPLPGVNRGVASPETHILPKPRNAAREYADALVARRNPAEGLPTWDEAVDAALPKIGVYGEALGPTGVYSPSQPLPGGQVTRDIRATAHDALPSGRAAGLHDTLTDVMPAGRAAGTGPNTGATAPPGDLAAAAAAVAAQREAAYKVFAQLGGVSPGAHDAVVASLRKAVDDLAPVLERAGLSNMDNVSRNLGVDRVVHSSPIGDAFSDLWAMRQAVKKIGKSAEGKGRGNHMVEWMLGGAGGMAGFKLGAAVGGPVAGAAVANIGRHVGRGIGVVSGMLKEASDRGAKALSSVLSSRAARRAPLLAVVSANYDPAMPGARGSRDIRKKAAALTRAAASPEATKAAITREQGDLPAVDPDLSERATEAAWTRVKNLHAVLPKTLEAQAVREFEIYEAVTHDPTVIWDMVARGAVPEIAVRAYREQHTLTMARQERWLWEHAEEIAEAPLRVRRGIDAVFGTDFAPEAAADFTYRQQLRMQEAARKDEAQGAQPQPTGNSTPGTISAVLVTTGQAVSRPNVGNPPR